MKKLKRVIFNLVDEDRNEFLAARIFNFMIITLILLNVVAIILESFSELNQQYKAFFDDFELASVILFGIEYLLRLFTANLKYPNRKGVWPYFRYLISPLAVIDLMAILPSLIIFVAPYYSPLARLIDLRFIRMLRIMRLFRIFKISRYSKSLRMIGEILREKRRDLGITIFITFILMVISSTLMYYAEHEAQGDQFPNIVATFWWAVATLTTVGYGDVFPVTVVGKVLSGVIALLGIGLVALPTGILSSAFIERIEKEKEEKKKLEAEKTLASEGKEAAAPSYNFCPHCGEKLPHA